MNQGPQLLLENKHNKLLEQILRLSNEERQNINVKVLESFAYLKKWIVDKDKMSKQHCGSLYGFLERSRDRSPTPLLLKIAKDPEEYSRLYAVTLLGNMGDQRALSDLQHIANSDPNRKIRKTALHSIALIQRGK